MAKLGQSLNISSSFRAPLYCSCKMSWHLVKQNCVGMCILWLLLYSCWIYIWSLHSTVALYGSRNNFDWHNSFFTYLLCEYRFLPFQSTHLQLCSETWSHAYRYTMRVCYPLIGYIKRALHYHSSCLLFDMFNALFKTLLWRSVTYFKSIHEDIRQMLPCSYTGQWSDYSFWFVWTNLEYSLPSIWFGRTIWI